MTYEDPGDLRWSDAMCFERLIRVDRREIEILERERLETLARNVLRD